MRSTTQQIAHAEKWSSPLAPPVAYDIERDANRRAAAEQVAEVRRREPRVGILSPESDGRVLAPATQLVLQREHVRIARRLGSVGHGMGRPLAIAIVIDVDEHVP